LPTIKTITIKKAGGGTREQKVRVLKSGKYRFVKNTVKGMARKTRAVGRRAFEKAKPKRTKKTNKPKNSRNSVAKKSFSGRIPKVVKKAAAGLGLATIAAMVVGVFAPQYVPIVKPIAAYVGGGIEGIAAEVIIDHGLLNQITGMFGFGNGGGMVAQQEVGGL
jgi:hypothetical protein